MERHKEGRKVGLEVHKEGRKMGLEGHKEGRKMGLERHKESRKMGLEGHKESGQSCSELFQIANWTNTHKRESNRPRCTSNGVWTLGGDCNRPCR